MMDSGFLYLCTLCTVATVVSGYGLGEFRVKRQSEGVAPSIDECSKPHMWKNVQECCKLPNERIWGDLRASMNMCFHRMKRERRMKREETTEDAGEATTTMTPEEIEETSTETPVDSSTEPSEPTMIDSNSSPMPPPPSSSPGRPHRRKHPLHRPPNDGCFMECVFQDQGFMDMSGRVEKAALLRRLTHTLGRNEMWHSSAVAAVETCFQTDFQIPSNATCQSGAADIFRCVFKQIFFNCPNWPERSEYCTSLREYYQRCPNGPPPDFGNERPPLPEDYLSSTIRYTQK